MSLSTEIASELPFLRRYARALTGNQKSGDAYVRATLEAIVADPAQLSVGRIGASAFIPFLSYNLGLYPH